MKSASPVENLVEKSALAVRRLLRFEPAMALEIGPDDFLFDADGVEAVAAECAGIVLVGSDAARAETLLAAGPPCVLLGEAALIDSEMVARLAQAYPGCIGIYAPVQRQAVDWSFETVSNADFKTVTPSVCEPAWEVLKADGTPTGTQAQWWLGALHDLGATQFLVHADVRDDTDLNILAGLVEALGESLWIAPRSEECLPLADFVNYGQCRQLALSADEYERHMDNPA
jgi:hypothetical protein